MSHQQKIEQFIAGTEIDTHPARDQQVLREILETHEQSRQRQPQKQKTQPWRAVGGAGRGKWAVAALVPLAVVLSIVVSEALREPAWAIEQTIAALEGFRAIYATGILSLDGRTEMQAECWARPNKDGTRSGDMRLQTTSGYCIVVNEARDITHIYDPTGNSVEIRGGDGLYCNPWINGDFFREMKQSCEEWHEEYTKDASTGRKSVIVKARNLHNGQSYEFHFDLETKLPLRVKVWHNPDFAGAPYFNIDNIVYNPDLPEGIFDFQMPAGATIVGG